MDVLEAVENETLESHTMDILDTMEILEISKVRSCSSVGREVPCKGLERTVHIGEVTGSSPVKTTKNR